MSRYEKYMTDRSVENSLTTEEREEEIKSFNFGVAVNALEGLISPVDEEEYALYCNLNNISFETMIDNILEVRGLPPIDHSKAEIAQSEYDAHMKSLKG